MIGLWYIINLGGWVLKKALLAIIFALLFINYSLGSEAMKVEAPFKEGQDIPPMDGKSKRLVHITPDMVGP